MEEIVIINGRKLRKIGERHGEFRDDKYKPKPEPKNIDHARAKKYEKLLEFKQNLSEKATPSELFFKSKLDELNIKYIFQKGVIDKDHFMIADFFISRLNLVFEIDGGYHQTRKQILRDRAKDKHYKERHFTVIRIKNEDVESFDYNELLSCYKKGYVGKSLMNFTVLRQKRNAEFVDLNKTKKREPIVDSKGNPIQTKRKITKEGHRCRKCLTPVIRKTSDKKVKPNQSYFYAWYLYCPKCRTIYFDKSARRYL